MTSRCTTYWLRSILYKTMLRITVKKVVPEVGSIYHKVAQNRVKVENKHLEETFDRSLPYLSPRFDLQVSLIAVTIKNKVSKIKN